MSQDLIKALERLMRHFPTDSDMAEAGWTAQEIEAACVAHEAASAALSRHRSSVDSVELPEVELFTHELIGVIWIDGKLAKRPNGVHLGVTERGICEQAHTEGETSEEVLEWFSASTVRSLIAAAVERERGLCAKVCDEVKAEAEQWARGADTGMYDHQAQGAENCAAAIRARGEMK